MRSAVPRTLCLREHVDDKKPAIMTRAREQEDDDWIGGHAHEIAVPLIRRALPPRPRCLSAWFLPQLLGMASRRRPG